MHIINLDENVLQALDFFAKNEPPRINLEKYTMPFVIGSGNAYNTGVILFSGQAAIFADESNFKFLIKAYAPIIAKKLIKNAIIISASGEKDSVWEASLAKEHGLKTTLLTCEKNSSAATIADEVFTYRKIAEPYTYNVSTYLGMIFSATEENPRKIKSFMEKINLPKNFSNYSAYSFILPDQFGAICPMLDIKKSELFGPHLSLRAFPDGHARHAKFVIRSKKELVIGIGTKNKFFGHPEHRLDIQLPKNSNFGTIMSLTYFLTGRIQSAKPDYFQKNISAYCQNYGPQAYGKKESFDLIVPGN